MPIPASSPAPSPIGRPALLLGALLAFAVGLALPLGDPDLGLHLRVGEWIVTHGTLPRVEPFAWTRAGAPFFAYSWLAEVTYYAILRASGPIGLHVLQGLTTLGAAAAAWWYARSVRLPGFAASIFVIGHLLTMLTVSLALRPQGMLSICVPVCWVAATRLADPTRSPARWPYVVLWAATAVAANTHLLAPLCLAPLVLLVPDDGARVRVALGAVAAGVAGLFTTPYALDWPAILRLNFAPNAMFRFPSPITEHQPGFVFGLGARDTVLALSLVLAALPWIVTRPIARRRVVEVLLALGWLAGLALFATAARALLVWWLASFPLLALAARRLPEPSASPVGHLLRAMPAVLLVVVVVRGAQATATSRAFEGDTTRRTIAARGAAAAMLLADTLDVVAPAGSGRVLTSFDYGNALLWRLPRYSMSIDGRTIFPDSAAAMEGWMLGRALPDSLPWVAGSADVAVLPLVHAASRRLARTPGWERIAVARARFAGEVTDSAGLWVRTTWLARHARARAP